MGSCRYKVKHQGLLRGTRSWSQCETVLAWELCIHTRFGDLGLQVWWPLSLIQTPGHLWLGTTFSQATPWLLLTSPIPWWEQQQSAPPPHRPPPLTPHDKRECGLTFHPGEEMELQVPGRQLEETLNIGVLGLVCFLVQERVMRGRMKVDSQC